MEILRANLHICLFSVLVGFFSNLNATELDGRVVDYDHRNIGVKCKIILVAIDGKEMPVDKTNDDGYFSLSSINAMKCDTIKFEPYHVLYHSIKESFPIKKNEIFVYSIKYTTNLYESAKILEAEKKYADAAMVFSEIAARERKANPEKSKIAEAKVYSLFSDHITQFGQTDLYKKNWVVYDEKQDKKVMGKNLKNYVMNVQEKNNLKATGKIDYNTLRLFTEKDIGYYIY